MDNNNPQAPNNGYNQPNNGRYNQQAPNGYNQQMNNQQAPNNGYNQQYNQNMNNGYNQQYNQNNGYNQQNGGYNPQYNQQAPNGGYQQPPQNNGPSIIDHIKNGMTLTDWHGANYWQFIGILLGIAIGWLHNFSGITEVFSGIDFKKILGLRKSPYQNVVTTEVTTHFVKGSTLVVLLYALSYIIDIIGDIVYGYSVRTILTNVISSAITVVVMAAIYAGICYLLSKHYDRWKTSNYKVLSILMIIGVVLNLIRIPGILLSLAFSTLTGIIGMVLTLLSYAIQLATWLIYFAALSRAEEDAYSGYAQNPVNNQQQMNNQQYNQQMNNQQYNNGYNQQMNNKYDNGQYNNQQYDNGQYDNGQYDNGQYDNAGYAEQQYDDNQYDGN
ncbi:MAG: hypothetical protein IJ593_06315 [Lachnospiraceae bacterium]|nr:hypothetical protein [Lachnospiraceae bacterium]